jgi:hypothetical protein
MSPPLETPVVMPEADAAQPAQAKLVDSESPASSVRRYRPDPLFHRVLLVLCSGVVLLSMVLSVRERTQVLLPVIGTPLPELCMMKRMTDGLGCPGCGMTRSFISIGHGDLARAWSYNPAGLWFYGIILFQIPFRGVQLWRIRRGLPELQLARVAQVSLAILAVVMIGQWVLKLSGLNF